jgi:hypothetical protein
LFNSDTSRLTPLDFRLTAAAQFRVLKALCSLVTEGVNILQYFTIGSSTVNTETSSRLSLNSELNSLVAQFNGLSQTLLLSNRAPQFIMMAIMRSQINSAVNTNAFLLNVPGSDQYETINNFYPLYDNASYNNVSYFNILSYF